MVLIESDWNLKEEREDELLAKDWVLIESDWNLKIRRYVINRRCILHVLIESDWNLKGIQPAVS